MLCFAVLYVAMCRHSSRLSPVAFRILELTKESNVLQITASISSDKFGKIIFPQAKKKGWISMDMGTMSPECKGIVFLFNHQMQKERKNGKQIQDKTYSS